MISERRQRVERAAYVLGLELDDEIEVDGRSQMSVENDGDPADDEIADAGVIESREHPLELADHRGALPAACSTAARSRLSANRRSRICSSLRSAGQP